MIPTELITLTGSSVIGGALKIITQAAQAKREERLFTLQALSGQQQMLQQARQYSNTGFQWTRRTIALMAVFSIVALPKLAQLWAPELAITIGSLQPGASYWLFSAPSSVQWASHTGIVITPLDTHLLSAIIGLYFGASISHR